MPLCSSWHGYVALMGYSSYLVPTLLLIPSQFWFLLMFEC